MKPRYNEVPARYNERYYSANWRDAHTKMIWSESNCYPSSLHNRYPAIYVGNQDSSEIVRSASHPHLYLPQKEFRREFVE